jgi:hypothetical protein
MTKVQSGTIVLPQSGVGLEYITDALVHYSIPLLTYGLGEKTIDFVAAAPPVPGATNLLVWLEVSSYSATGGFALVGSPIVIVNNPPGSFRYRAIAWTMESRWARLAVQYPIPVAGLPWVVQAAFEART